MFFLIENIKRDAKIFQIKEKIKIKIVEDMSYSDKTKQMEKDFYRGTTDLAPPQSPNVSRYVAWRRVRRKRNLPHQYDVIIEEIS